MIDRNADLKAELTNLVGTGGVDAWVDNVGKATATIGL